VIEGVEGVEGVELVLLVDAASVEAADVFAPDAPTHPVCASTKAQTRSKAKQAKGLAAVRSLGAFPCRGVLRVDWRVPVVIFITYTAYGSDVMSHTWPNDRKGDRSPRTN
jgi:hypothetical protein